jgi:flavin reductase
LFIGFVLLSNPGASTLFSIDRVEVPGNVTLAENRTETAVGAAPVDQTRFREAMSRVGAAVHIVTTDGPAGLDGITASAVTSITLSPPMMLFCIKRTSRCAAKVIENGVFCVNTLARADQQLSDIFAGRTGQKLEERFASTEWTVLATGAPVLASALVAFDCRLVEAKEVGTHLMMIGTVEAVEIAPKAEALMYAHREYWRL